MTMMRREIFLVEIVYTNSKKSLACGKSMHSSFSLNLKYQDDLLMACSFPACFGHLAYMFFYLISDISVRAKKEHLHFKI
jgi:hypothetical protein